MFLCVCLCECVCVLCLCCVCVCLVCVFVLCVWVFVLCVCVLCVCVFVSVFVLVGIGRTRSLRVLLDICGQGVNVRKLDLLCAETPNVLHSSSLEHTVRLQVGCVASPSDEHIGIMSSSHTHVCQTVQQCCILEVGR